MAVQPGRELPPEEQDWHRFQQLRQLHNHWQRPGWAEGRRSYHWLLTFEHASSLRTLAAQCQEPFRDLLQFDLIPLGSLHLTLHRLAFTDELPESRLPAIVAAVRHRCRNLESLRLRIGWLAASAGAIRFTALPVAAIADVRNTVLGLTDLPGAQENTPACTNDDDFWPHVSIVYSNTVQPAAAIAGKIEALRYLPPAQVLVNSLALVELRRDGRAYWWDEVERVKFG
ncbi:MAG: 2'-5' RNA ligase family protein [Gemmatimonadales bacterium]